MREWSSALRMSRRAVKLLVTDWQGNDVLKARFVLQPQHPRALLTLLEGISLYSGHPLEVALCAEESCPQSLGQALLGDELWPAESQLVRFVVDRRERQPVRLAGLGDFRELRRGLEVGR